MIPSLFFEFFKKIGRNQHFSGIKKKENNNALQRSPEDKANAIRYINTSEGHYVDYRMSSQQKIKIGITNRCSPGKTRWYFIGSRKYLIEYCSHFSIDLIKALKLVTSTLSSINNFSHYHFPSFRGKSLSCAEKNSVGDRILLDVYTQDESYIRAHTTAVKIE